jgi:hypothetical protein
MQFHFVSIYIDDVGKIILIPQLMIESDFYIICTLDNIDEFYNNLVECYRMTFTTGTEDESPRALTQSELLAIMAEDEKKVTALEKATNSKSWTKAIKKVDEIGFRWNEKEGFYLNLTKRASGGCLYYTISGKIPLGTELDKEVICKKIVEEYNKILEKRRKQKEKLEAKRKSV